MRFLQMPWILMLSVVFAGTAIAEDDAGDRSDRGEFRQKMIEEFDADGDGKLSDEERSTAREKMRGRRGKDGKKGREGRKGRPGGDGPPNPEELFKKFDVNGDDQLSREEFLKLSEEMRERRANRRPGRGGPGEGRGRRRGPEGGPDDRSGPPRGERRDFRPPGPLQNPDDRPGPPREGRPGRKGPPDGPGARGPEGRRPPNPSEVFDRFDANGDDQLSREEFMELSETMRAMHDRSGRGAGRRFGEGRGDRRGPPGRGRGSDRPDRPRPPRPDFEEGSSGAEATPTEDNSV